MLKKLDILPILYKNNKKTQYCLKYKTHGKSPLNESDEVLSSWEN